AHGIPIERINEHFRATPALRSSRKLTSAAIELLGKVAELGLDPTKFAKGAFSSDPQYALGHRYFNATAQLLHDLDCEVNGINFRRHDHNDNGDSDARKYLPIHPNVVTSCPNIRGKRIFIPHHEIAGLWTKGMGMPPDGDTDYKGVKNGEAIGPGQ